MLEHIQWIKTSESMPDSDITVLLFNPANTEEDPVWLGYFDGTDWRYVHGSLAPVPIAWADMPQGPSELSND